VSEHSGRTDRLASLFVDVTGQSSITERQRVDVAVRVDESDDDARSLAAATGIDGLEDAIGDPETA
jgi:hypothetical protein